MKSNQEISILHANSNVLMHRGLVEVCGQDMGVSKLDQASDRESLFNRLSKSDYDIVIIDPNKDHGFQQDDVLMLKEKYDDQSVLIISSTTDENMVLNNLERGVQGYLTYECDKDELIHALFAIKKGEKFYCNKVLDIVFNKHLYKREEDNCEPTSLTPRETEIASLLAKGLTNKEVAEMIFLSPHTVQTHRKNLMKKLGIRSASELTLYAVSTGLIQA
ncbi:MAG: response regulator transcription factor [Vicingaceae bacterium]